MTDWLLGCCYLLIGFYLVLGATVQVLRSRLPVFFEPGYLVLLFLVFVYFIHPALMLWNDLYKYGDEYSYRSHLLSLLVSILFTGSFIVGYYFSPSTLTTLSDHEKLPNLEIPMWLLILSFTILVVVPAFAARTILDLILTYGFDGFMRNRIILTSGSGYTTALLQWPSLFVYLVVVTLAKENTVHSTMQKSLYVVLAVLALVTAIVFALMSGSRANSVTPILLALFLFLLLRKTDIRKMLVHLGLSCLIALIMVAQLGTLRQQIMTRSAESTISNPRSILEVYVALSHNFGVSEHVLWWFDNLPKTELQYGTTFAAVLVGWIPRSLWQDKPLGAGPAIVNMRSPGSYNLQGYAISSNTTGLVFESFMNFGFLGPIAVGSIYGMVIRQLKRWIYKSPTDVELIIWVLMLYFLLLYLIGEFFGTTAKMVVQILPVFIVNIYLNQVGAKQEIYPAKNERLAGLSNSRF